MDVKLYEYVIFNNNQELAKKEEIKDFVDQMKRDEVFYFDNTSNAYVLKNQKEKDESVLLHFYQSSEINYENFRRGQEKFTFLEEDDLGDIKSIKHIFIFVDYKTKKFYMNHIFKSLDRVVEFLGYNSSVFKENLQLKSLMDENSIESMMKFVNSIVFKTVPEDVMFALIGGDFVNDFVREPEIKSTMFKIDYKKRLKRLDSFIRSHISAARENKNEVIINYTDVNDNDCYFNTKKMMKYIYIGAFGLANDAEEKMSFKTIFNVLKEMSSNE